jgi:hypothetical protein
MGNMSYCRFENTYSALEDCYDSLLNEKGIDELSNNEKEFAIKLLKMCKNISEDFWLEIQNCE